MRDARAVGHCESAGAIRQPFSATRLRARRTVLRLAGNGHAGLSGLPARIPQARERARDSLPEECKVQRLPVRLSETVAVRDSPSCLALTQSQLGVEVPAMPGDVGLCGALSKETLEAVARRYTSWVYLNTSSDPDFMPDVLKRFGVKAIEARRSADGVTQTHTTTRCQSNARELEVS